ncbi:MAG: malto-oligosyltrehalose trehalohydrolase [Acidimicrobiia bacterium]
MHEFRVWAPRAEKSVEVVIVGRGERVAMKPRERGWWSVEVADAGPGTDYLLSLDGGEARPDPRSMFQPEGIDGPSRVVDHSSFEWTDAAWHGIPVSSALIYEMHVGTFTSGGTFDDAIDRLGHLVDLGVNTVELLPVVEFSGDRGWGYDGVDLYAPHHAYGGPDGLKRFVDACHQRDLAVILDVVYNHLGPAGNYLPVYGPYFTDKYGTPWGDAVNYDGAGSDEVRAFVLDNVEMWLRDYHVDGLRLDAVHAIHDESAVHLLEEMSERVDRLEAELGRSLFLIAESDLNDPRFINQRELGGLGMDAQWSDELHHALHSVLTGERSGYYADFGSYAQLARGFERSFVYAGEYSQHRQRRHGRPPLPGTPGWRFLAYIQNHDQIGNRAVGERITALVSHGRAKIAAALVLCSPFVPMLFQGEEWGASTPFQYFTDHPDPELGKAVSEGRRSEFSYFGWDPADVPDPQDVGTFERSKLDWSELDTEAHKGFLDWHRQLIALRRSLPQLSDGRLDRVWCRFDEDREWFVLGRGDLALVCNLADSAQDVALHRLPEEILIASGETELGAAGVRIAPESAALVRLSGPG